MAEGAERDRRLTLEALVARRRRARDRLARSARVFAARARDPLRLKEHVRDRPLVTLGAAAGASYAVTRFVRSGLALFRRRRADPESKAAPFGVGAALGMAFRSFILPRLVAAGREKLRNFARHRAESSDGVRDEWGGNPGGAEPDLERTLHRRGGIS